MASAAATRLQAGWSRLKVPAVAWEPLIRLGLDLAEDVDRDAGTVTARLRPGDADRLAGLGIRVLSDSGAVKEEAFRLPEGYTPVTGIQRRVRSLA